MATIETKRITELPVAASVSGSEAIPLVQAGVTYQTTLQTIADQMLTGPAGPEGHARRDAGQLPQRLHCRRVDLRISHPHGASP